MDNEKNGQQDSGNVIPFPNLKDRLFEKGMAALQQKKYREALPVFQQLRDMEGGYPQVQAGIVICLLELGRLEEARAESKRLLNEDIGDYFENLQIYITVLIQMNEYDEAAAVLEAVMEEHRLPAEAAETLYQLLDFSRQMSERPEPAPDEQREEVPAIDPADLIERLTNGNAEEQLRALQQLRSLELSPYIATLDSMLKSGFAPELKTMLLEIMIEKKLSREIEIWKFGKRKTIVPATLDGVFESDFGIQVLNVLDEKLGQENPALFQLVQELWHRHLFVIYPFEPDPADPAVWAGALHQLGYLLHSIPVTLEETAEEYGIEAHILEESVTYLRKLEEESFNGSML
ncbi:tetratricopeptide repeat protein [Bacillus marinisedimentorum]|uniref:tetratricopeptide repeat protein n=1 Tax=Bacillus marinisedimentorum TaxID=1821260 RepID=UPI0007DF3027|nr:tetratricopeptide repeat protein [Bacillus marinisedimentorum]